MTQPYNVHHRIILDGNEIVREQIKFDDPCCVNNDRFGGSIVETKLAQVSNLVTDTYRVLPEVSVVGDESYVDKKEEAAWLHRYLRAMIAQSGITGRNVDQMVDPILVPSTLSRIRQSVMLNRVFERQSRELELNTRLKSVLGTMDYYRALKELVFKILYFPFATLVVHRYGFMVLENQMNLNFRNNLNVSDRNWVLLRKTTGGVTRDLIYNRWTHKRVFYTYESQGSNCGVYSIAYMNPTYRDAGKSLWMILTPIGQLYNTLLDKLNKKINSGLRDTEMFDMSMIQNKDDLMLKKSNSDGLTSTIDMTKDLFIQFDATRRNRNFSNSRGLPYFREIGALNMTMNGVASSLQVLNEIMSLISGLGSPVASSGIRTDSMLRSMIRQQFGTAVDFMNRLETEVILPSYRYIAAMNQLPTDFTLKSALDMPVVENVPQINSLMPQPQPQQEQPQQEAEPVEA